MRRALEWDGPAELLDDVTAIVRIDYRAMWLRELRARRGGQRLDIPSTWAFDSLWSAVCYQLRAEDAERLLNDAMKSGAIVGLPDGRHLRKRCGLAALVDVVAAEWRNAHTAALGTGGQHAA